MLAVKGSSVPSERVASVAGNIVTYKRSRLSAEFVEDLTMCSMNWKFLEDITNLQELVQKEVGENIVVSERVFEDDY